MTTSEGPGHSPAERPDHLRDGAVRRGRNRPPEGGASRRAGGQRPVFRIRVDFDFDLTKVPLPLSRGPACTVTLSYGDLQQAAGRRGRGSRWACGRCAGRRPAPAGGIACRHGPDPATSAGTGSGGPSNVTSRRRSTVPELSSGELHGPGQPVLTGAVAHGDPAPGQPQVGGVVVDGLKVASRKRDSGRTLDEAAQIRQPHIVRCYLSLASSSGRHGPPSGVGVRCRTPAHCAAFSRPGAGWRRAYEQYRPSPSGRPGPPLPLPGLPRCDAAVMGSPWVRLALTWPPLLGAPLDIG